MIRNSVADKFDIIILAGQSNAEGSGKGDVEFPYQPKASVQMLCGDFSAVVRQVDYGNDYLELNVENEYYIKDAEERTDKGMLVGNFAFTFSDLYLENDLDKDRKILIIYAPIGGTGFSKNHWGKGDILFNRMMQMIRDALAMNKENKVVAFLWHQGEHDAYENENFSVSEREEYYYNKFDALISDVRAEFGNDIPVICAKFSKVWAEDYKEKCEAIYRATERVCEKIGNAVVLETYDLSNNHEVIGNEDAVHFSRPALQILGERYYKAYKQIVNKEK